jgi:alkaline phosphatase
MNRNGSTDKNPMNKNASAASETGGTTSPLAGDANANGSKSNGRNARQSTSGFSRRDFLKTGALSGLFLGTGGLMGCANGNNSQRGYHGRAKNVIFLVSDGMSAGTLSMADSMLRRRDGRPSNWIRLYEEGRVSRGLMDMASANSIVTDSAAAASSWGCGARIVNGAVNMGPDGEEFPVILPIFRDAGKATGLVTTTRITHATPAGFSVNSPERGLEDEIAIKQVNGGFDVLYGGGNSHFDPEWRRDGFDLYADAAGKGYSIFRTKQEMTAWDGSGQAIGIFADSHLPYTVDHLNTPELMQNVPSLAELTRAAINRLSRNPNGFILQIEGGRVDHAAHGNDVAGLIFDQIAFDDAIGAVLEFTANRDDTLVIITTDHGNANPGLNGEGSGYNDSNINFDKLQHFRHSNDWILSGLNRDSSINEIRARFEEATGLEMDRRHAEILRQSYRDEYESIYTMMRRPWAVLGQILANHTSVNFVGTAHTSDYVELAAYGPGSEAIGAFTRNTDLFGLMTRAAGVEIPVSSAYPG